MEEMCQEFSEGPLSPWASQGQLQECCRAPLPRPHDSSISVSRYCDSSLSSTSEGVLMWVQWDEIRKRPVGMSVNNLFSYFLSLMTPLSAQSSVLSNLYHSFNTWFLMVIIKPFSLSTDTNWHIKPFVPIRKKIMILLYQTLITITGPKTGVNCVSCYTVTDHTDSGLHHVIIFIH